MVVYLKIFKKITSAHLNSTGHTNYRQKATQTTKQRDIWTYKLDWTPLGTFGTQFGVYLLCINNKLHIFKVYMYVI